MRTHLWWALLSLPLLAQQAPLTYEQLAARARPAPEFLAVEADLARRQQSIAQTGGFFRQAPTIGLEAGPRRPDGGTPTTDRSLSLEVPLLLRPGLRNQAQRELEVESPLTQAVIRLESRLQLRAAYLDAWLAEKVVERRRRDVASLEQWRSIASRRVEAGADPSFQGDLVEGELLRVQSALTREITGQAAAWGRLRALCDLPESPQPLADPGSPVWPQTAELESRFQNGVLRQAALARAASRVSGTRLDHASANARWSIRADHAREGLDRVTHLGLAYRFGRPGEYAAARHSAETRVAAAERAGEWEQIELEARFSAARDALKSLPAAQTPRDWAGALAAVDLRLKEGRERASDAIPIRRLLLDGEITWLELLRESHFLVAELETLTAGESS